MTAPDLTAAERATVTRFDAAPPCDESAVDTLAAVLREASEAHDPCSWEDLAAAAYRHLSAGDVAGTPMWLVLQAWPERQPEGWAVQDVCNSAAAADQSVTYQRGRARWVAGDDRYAVLPVTFPPHPDALAADSAPTQGGGQ